jgi:hypothetical protein
MSVKRMRFSETIIVPLGRISVLERARASAVEVAGGITILFGQGSWKAADGEVVHDKVAQLTVWSDDGAVIDTWVKGVRDDLFSVGERDVLMWSSQTDNSPYGSGTMAGVFSQ